MSTFDNNVTLLGPYRQARLMAKMVREISKTPLGKVYELMSIKACRDPEKLRECMAEVCKRDKKAPDYLKWPNELTGDMRIWMEIFDKRGLPTGFERAFYFWMHRTDFCTSTRSMPFGMEDSADESETMDALKRSAIFALTGKWMLDAITAAAPAMDLALARFFPLLIPRSTFEKQQDPIL